MAGGSWMGFLNALGGFLFLNFQMVRELLHNSESTKKQHSEFTNTWIDA